MTSGLRQLYPGIKARPSSRWWSFVLSVLQMAVPTGESLHAHPPCRPLSVNSIVGIADRPAHGCFSCAAVRQPDRTPDGCGRPSSRPPRLSAWRTASSVPRPSAGSSTRPSTARTASCLVPAPNSPPPPPRRSPPPTILSMVEFQVSIKRAAQTPSVCFRTYVSQEL